MVHSDRPERVDTEVDEELRFHLEGRIRELVAEGWTEEDARREAARRFGDLDRIRTDCRAFRRETVQRRRRRGGMEAWGQDVRLAFREIIRDRGLSALVVVTLALGIGFATALFSVVDGVLLRPLAYESPDRLVYVWQNDRATGTTREPAGTADFYDFRERSRAFAGISMFGPWSGSLLRDGAEPRDLSLVAAHHDLAGVLGVEPAIGRFVTAAETEGGDGSTMVLTDRFWRAEFDADPGVLGTVVRLNGEPFDIVGVLPPGADAVMGGGIDAVTPLVMTAAQATRSPHYVTVVGRLAPGVELETARSEMTEIAARLEEEVPANANRGAFVEPVAAYLRGDVAGTLWALMGAVGVLVLLAGLNVTNLLLARASARSRESAVHSALGAGALRTARRNLSATLLLTGLAGLLGVGVASLSLRVLLEMVPPDLLDLGVPTLDVRVLGFTLVLVLLLGIAFGLAPTTAALRLDLQSSLGQGRGDASGGRAGVALRRVLVAGQAGLAALLLVGAVLLGVTLRNLHAVDRGFSTESTLRMSFTLPQNRYPVDFSVYPDLPERLAFQAEALRRVEELPGVEAAALVVNHPLDPGFTNSISIEGRPPDPALGELTTRMITPGYFEVADLRVVEGRAFHVGETVDQPGVVVLNRTAAELLFPDEPALGQRIGFWGAGFREVVGIVEDERVHGLREAAPPAFYTNLDQTPPAGGTLVLMVKTRGEPLALAEPVRRAIWSVDPLLAISDVTTMEATLASAMQRERLASTVLTVFSGMALILAALGVYGVLSYSVTTQRREMGIRLALGADRGRLRWMVVRQGTGLVLVGLAAGLAVARLAARGLESLLFGVGAGATSAYVASGVALLLVAFAATALPAWRASRVAPAESLRSD